MKLACACSSALAHEFSTIVIDVNEAYIAWLLNKVEKGKELRAEDTEFYALEYFDYHADYYPMLDELTTIDADGQDFIVLPDDWEPSRDVLRTDLNTVVVGIDHIQWTASPKNGSAGERLESPFLSINFLKAKQQELAAA